MERVAWREIKGAVIYRLEQAGQTTGGRGVITRKYVIAWQGDPQEFGRRVQTEDEAMAAQGCPNGSGAMERFARSCKAVSNGAVNFGVPRHGGPAGVGCGASQFRLGCSLVSKLTLCPVAPRKLKTRSTEQIAGIKDPSQN